MLKNSKQSRPTTARKGANLEKSTVSHNSPESDEICELM